MKTVIVSPEILGPHKNGGIGTFATTWAQMLRDKGDEVMILYTGEVNSPTESWMPLYEDIEVIHVEDDEPEYSHFNYEFFVRRAEKVSDYIPADADVVYFQDWLANGFHFLRQRKFSIGPKPTCVTITHSPHQWILEANKTFPSQRLDLELAFAERYQVEHSDFLASPSHYMVNYIRKNGWKLPPEDKIHVLGYPFLKAAYSSSQNKTIEKQFRRIVFFGRIETRKGIELFVDSLHLLAQRRPDALREIHEVALLGRLGVHRFGAPDELLEQLKRSLPEANIRIFSELDTFEAQSYLSDHSSDSLVVAPSLIDNFPYALIEASLISGLNLISSSSGGQPEILGQAGESQLFYPNVRHLTQKLEEKLTQGPSQDHERGHYNWQLANQKWLEFHEMACRYKASNSQIRVNFNNSTHPMVDVCVPYFNHAQYLPSTLESLAKQTTDHFNLYVVNDGSTDTNANAVFEKMRQRYSHKPSWHFIDRQENHGLSETRNYASSLGNAEYLLFVDSDNIAAPGMVERFVECMELTDYACLTCNVFWFQGSDRPYLKPQPGLLQKPVMYWPPLGNSIELGLFHDCWGDANFIIKRSIFESIGQFRVEEPLDKYRTGEDWEILARLSFAGYKLDVIPEVLFFYRYLPDSMNRLANEYESVTRALRVYAKELEKLGLHHLIPWIYQVYRNSNLLPASRSGEAHQYDDVYEEVRLTYEILKQDPEWIANNIPWSRVIRGMLRKVTKKMLPRR